MTSTNRLLNDYLENRKIPRAQFDDLRIVVETVGLHQAVLDWFVFLQAFEIVGWRPRLVTQKIARMLADSGESKPVEFYAFFCPSYVKGHGAYGFRTDGVGETTLKGTSNLQFVVEKTKQLGIPCCRPRAIFFDIAIEQPERAIGKIADLETNIENIKKHIPDGMVFQRLGEVFPFLSDYVGYRGIKVSPLPVPKTTLDRIVERGAKFYERFGWSQEQIVDRSEVIASSEALVGSVVRHAMPNSIMVYTPTMLERAQVYSGFKFERDPLPIIFPKK